MITSLNVRFPEKRRGIKGFMDKLSGDRVEVKDSVSRGVALRNISYISRSGEVRLEKLDPYTGAERGRLLCSDKFIFPPKSGYGRFHSTAFSSRLCTNFALTLISQCKNAATLRVGIYDPNAYCADFLLSVLALCSDVTVVTSYCEPYLCVADRALNEMGAAALITKSRAELSGRSLIIAPQRIAEALPVSQNAVVLTAAEPYKDPGGSVFFRYRFKMPNGFSEAKPEGLSEEYFCSALYSLAQQHELGSIVPLSACGKNAETDAKTLAQILDKPI